jgi:hypothetical protein
MNTCLSVALQYLRDRISGIAYSGPKECDDGRMRPWTSGCRTVKIDESKSISTVQQDYGSLIRSAVPRSKSP